MRIEVNIRKYAFAPPMSSRNRAAGRGVGRRHSPALYRALNKSPHRDASFIARLIHRSSAAPTLIELSKRINASWRLNKGRRTVQSGSLRERRNKRRVASSHIGSTRRFSAVNPQAAARDIELIRLDQARSTQAGGLHRYDCVRGRFMSSARTCFRQTTTSRRFGREGRGAAENYVALPSAETSPYGAVRRCAS
jgi:hypothetical protein